MLKIFQVVHVTGTSRVSFRFTHKSSKRNFTRLKFIKNIHIIPGYFKVHDKLIRCKAHDKLIRCKAHDKLIRLKAHDKLIRLKAHDKLIRCKANDKLIRCKAHDKLISRKAHDKLIRCKAHDKLIRCSFCRNDYPKIEISSILNELKKKMKATFYVDFFVPDERMKKGTFLGQTDTMGISIYYLKI